MANKNLFASLGSLLPRADVRNEAGGRAYRLAPRHALAQLAATGCFNNAYYNDAEQQLATLLALVEQVDDNVYLAKLALYSRERAFLKDMPAALLVVLSKRDPALFGRIFDRIVDNGRVLRTLFQMIRSGQFGRTSLSYALQRAFQRWLNTASVGMLLSASIGNDPSLRDVLRLARPTPADNARRALFGFLADRPVEKWAPATLADLPHEVGELLAFRNAESEAEQVAILEQARFRWDLLADTARGPAVWKAIARQMGPQALRMNLNTLLRHDALSGDLELVMEVAGRIADPDEIRKSRQFPYQYLAAYLNAEANLPVAIREALGQRPRRHAATCRRCRSRSSSAWTCPARWVRRSPAIAAVTRPARCAASMWPLCSPRRWCAATRAARSSRSTPRRTRSRWVRTSRSSTWPAGWLATAAAAPTARCRWPRPTALTATGASPAACWSATWRVGSARAPAAPRAS